MTHIESGKIYKHAIHWLLFFAIAVGLGYPAVSRFDPRTAPGCADSTQYFEMVAGTPAVASQLSLRPLVPWVARPVLRISEGRVGSWNPVAFSLLIAGSMFTATAALLLLQIGTRCALPPGTALVGTLLYLLNFTVHNKHVGCGLVDSGESCLMLALFWLLFERRFLLLPVAGVVGALAKETFIPMAALATAGWAVIEFRRGRWKAGQTLAAIGMIFVGLCTTVVLQFAAYDRLILPWEFAAQIRSDPWVNDTSLFTGLIGVLTSRQFWYIFGWLLPLGALRLTALPATWVGASLGGAAAALAMGAWINAGGVAAPAVFNAIGPLLSMSAAVFLTSSRDRTPAGS